jgi:hypothetical protein
MVIVSPLLGSPLKATVAVPAEVNATVFVPGPFGIVIDSLYSSGDVKVPVDDDAVADVATFNVFEPFVIVNNVAAVVGAAPNAPVADAAAAFSVNVKVLLEPLVTVTVSLVEVGRLLTVSVACSGVGGLASRVVVLIVTLERGLPEPLFVLMVPTELGPFRSTLQSFLMGLRLGCGAEGGAAIAAAQRVAKSAGAADTAGATAC